MVNPPPLPEASPLPDARPTFPEAPPLTVAPPLPDVPPLPVAPPQPDAPPLPGAPPFTDCPPRLVAPTLSSHSFRHLLDDQPVRRSRLFVSAVSLTEINVNFRFFSWSSLIGPDEKVMVEELPKRLARTCDRVSQGGLKDASLATSTRQAVAIMLSRRDLVILLPSISRSLELLDSSEIASCSDFSFLCHLELLRCCPTVSHSPLYAGLESYDIAGRAETGGGRVAGLIRLRSATLGSEAAVTESHWWWLRHD